MTGNHLKKLTFNHSNDHITSITYPCFGDVISFYCFMLTTFSNGLNSANFGIENLCTRRECLKFQNYLCDGPSKRLIAKRNMEL